MKIKLSNTSKMPCKSWGIPQETCKTGNKLAKIEGTICFDCYAAKGAYSWPVVKSAYQTRLDQFNSNKDEWTETMIATLSRQKSKYFRWFDSGDLQSLEMLEAIVTIAAKLPHIRFWLPTHEVKVISDYVRRYGADWPENLTIRLSDVNFDKKTVYKGILAPLFGNKLFKSGAVKTKKATCPAPSQQGKCDDCRACWDQSKSYVTYKAH